MGSTFNPQILMEKLAKLNSSQQSIETLSHWCIFHMNKAKNVVETWARQFHSSPRDQRLAFLYLSNDILQNSRRKGSEFVGEFWKVLPDALRDVIENGDEFGRNAAIRLINIWEERKVFGSRGQLLKEELVGRKLDTSNRNGNPQASKLRNSAGNALDKIVSGYEIVYGSQLDEDAILSKCRNAISCVDKVDKEIGGDIRSVQLNGSGIVEEIKGQHAILTDCIEQLTTMESSRANLVFHLRQTLQEQEFKLDQVRSQLQAAQSQSAQAENLCKQILNTKETQTSKGPQSYISGSGEQTAPVMYTRQGSFADKPAPFEDNPKSTAAAVAAQLTASTSSAQMLTYVLSSLASEGVISNNTMNESSNDYPPEKKARREKEHAPYVPSQNPQPPAPQEQPPPPSSPPPMPPPLPPMQPYPVPQFTQPLPYSTVEAQYSVSSPFPVPPPNSYQNYQPEGGFYGQPSSSPMAPVSRQ